MKICPICKTKYPDDANFCPLETCASADGPQRLELFPEEPEPRFKPIERIGGGNTGEVWRARDNQTGTDVAFKLVNPEIAGSAANLSRVEREFKQLMRVASPRVASIIDCGRMPDQRLFVAMELFPGESLESVLRSGPVDLDTAKNIIGQVGQALLEAQKAGLVHRDVSPKNVLLGPNGDIKVINFPLAKPVTDKVAGEPAYLSPEQAQGKAADQRSNTYSLAAILYHLLTGEPPFQAASVQAVLDMHVSSPLLPPSQRRPDARISAETDRLMLKAMDKTSSRRHLTLRLFLTELEGVKPAVPGEAAHAAKAGDVGMAKTMLFAGNQSDVARMVADAMAARNAAAAAAAPAPAPVSAQPVAAVQPEAKPQAPANPISVMATLAADSLPASAHVSVPAQPVVQAAARSAPQAAAPKVEAPAAKSQPVGSPASASGTTGGGNIKPAQAGAAPPPKSGAAFRETLWFKKGDVEQLVADAKAKLATGGKPPAEGELPNEDVRPLEDRYVDDGSVTTEDRKKFSLRTGGTATALPVSGAAIPGKHMNEDDLVQEIGHGRRTAILLVAIAVVVLAVVLVFMSMKGGDKQKAGAAQPPSAAAKVPPPAPAPTPAAKPEPTPAPAGAAAVAPSIPAATPTTTATSVGTSTSAAAAGAGADKAAAEEGAKAKAVEPAAQESGKKAAKAKAAPPKGKRKR